MRATGNLSSYHDLCNLQYSARSAARNDTPTHKLEVGPEAKKPFYGRVHTTLFRTGRDRSRPVRAQLPVSTREQPERYFRSLETTSRHGTSGRDRSRSVAPCRLCRVDARPGASDLSANQPLLAHAFLIYFFPLRFHMYSIDYSNMTIWSKADSRTLIRIWGEASIQYGLDNCRRTVEVNSIRPMKFWINRRIPKTIHH